MKKTDTERKLRSDMVHVLQVQTRYIRISGHSNKYSEVGILSKYRTSQNQNKAEWVLLSLFMANNEKYHLAHASSSFEWIFISTNNVPKQTKKKTKNKTIN